MVYNIMEGRKWGLEKGGNEMSSINDLITAIMNRNFDRDEIESDIAFVNARFNILQTYFL